MAFKTLIVDVPWPFKDKLGNKGAANKYKLMQMSEIFRFPLPEMERDCVMLFWRVAAMQQEALDVIRVWGFNPPQRELIWLKKTKTGKRWFGQGHVVRAEHEVCLIATRGKPLVKDHSVRSTFVTAVDWDGLSAEARPPHSTKPEEFYEIVERLFEGPYCELFARRQRPGWTCLGNEVEANCTGS